MSKRKEEVDGEFKVSCLDDWRNSTHLQKKKIRKHRLGRGMMGLGIEHFQFEMEP